MDHAELSGHQHPARAVSMRSSASATSIICLERCLAGEGVQIYIGRESGYDALGECSLGHITLRGRWQGAGCARGRGSRSAWLIPRVVPVVDMTSKLLSAALNGRG